MGNNFHYKCRLCLISVNPKMFESPPILLKDFMEINLVKGKKKSNI
jgi:hypothetical protein